MTTLTRVRFSAALLGLTACLACAGDAQPLRIGATFTLDQSGALAQIDTAVAGRLVVILGPSGQILRSAAAGDLEIAIAHAPPLERRLVQSGRVALACPLFASRFAIVGPAADPARVAQATTAADAFRRIAIARAPFVSRGDSSGTHVKELELWRAARSTTGAGWYIESGTDQATALRVAAERRAYALADLPTWERLAPDGQRILFADDTMLTNPYTLYVMRPGDTAFARYAMDAWRARVSALGFVTRPGACAEVQP
ncbi:MAG: substrate-binding domain-containing protein [Gemmatimonadales bacterium]|nr:substrate-binding domain-containing protein [Gemmatimonadales bacterium]